MAVHLNRRFSWQTFIFLYLKYSNHVNGLINTMNICAVNCLNFGKTVYTEVGNLHGLHFSPSAAIAEISRKINKPIYFSHEKDVFEKDVRGSAVGLTLMEFTKGDRVKIRVDDDYPEYALQAVISCVRAFNNEGIDYAKRTFMQKYHERHT